MNKILLSFLLVFFSTILSFYSLSQKENNNELKLLFRLDNRNTHVRGHLTSIYGVFTGVNINNKLRLKIGASISPFEKGKNIQNEEIKKSTFYFFTIGEEFDFYRKNKFGFTSYLQCGYGKHTVYNYNLNNELLNKHKNAIVVFEMGLLAFYDLNNWLTFKLGGGWRFEFLETNNDLEGYFVKIAAGIKLKELYNTLFNEKK